MMACIRSDRSISCDFKSKEFVMVTAGGITFIVATIALAYFLISAPLACTMSHTVSYTLLSLVEVGSFASFVVGMYLRNYKQKQELADCIEDLKNIKPITIEAIALQETAVTSLDYIQQVRQELPPLFSALAELLEAFIIGYWGRRPPNLGQVRIAVDMIHTQVDSFLQHPQEILRVAIGIAAYNLIDEAKMGNLLLQLVSHVITQLPDMLLPPEAGYETQGKLIKHILQVIVSQANIADRTLRERVRELKNAYKAMSEATEVEEREEKMSAYQVALIALVDVLFSKANLSADRINTWTAHLVPPFLEQWKGSLFQQISDSMMGIHEAFNENGIFNDGVMKTKIRFGTTFPSKFIYPEIKAMIDASPLIPHRQAALQKAAETLIPVLIDPFYYGTFEANHPYRKKVQGILGSNDFVCPIVGKKTWKAHIDAY